MGPARVGSNPTYRPDLKRTQEKDSSPEFFFVLISPLNSCNRLNQPLGKLMTKRRGD